MCGIVLAGGTLVSTEVDVFTQLLYADVFRGVHATGVFAKRSDGIKFAKDAVPSHEFISSKEYNNVLTGEGKTTTYPSFLVGHNRHATRGNATDPKNAHPFQHGNITLVHNGTLYEQELLPDSSKFVVDSENICYSINKIGAAATIQKLHGAFTLIWHDASDDTVHIIRNDERPFHLAKAGMDWFGASEEDMLMWILKRHKSIGKRKIEHFECEVGVEYVFDVSGAVKKFVLKEEIKHTLPTFTYASRIYSGWQNGYSSSNANRTYGAQTEADRKARTRTEYNAIALTEGLSVRVDNRIRFIATGFDQYGGNSTKGKMTGYFMDNDGYDYVEVDAYAVEKSLYDDSQSGLKLEITGTIKAFIRVKNSVRILMNENLSLWNPDVSGKGDKIDQALTELADDVPFDADVVEELDSFRTVGGQQITYKFWHQHRHGYCMGCDKQIAWKDAPNAAYAYQAFWHPECLAKTEADEREIKSQVAENVDTFLCTKCGSEKSMMYLDSTASAIAEEDVCSSCGSEMRRTRDTINKPEYINANYVIESTGEIRSRMFNRREFETMVRQRDSDSIDFQDLSKARITQRSVSVYAYFYKKPVEVDLKKGESAKSSGNFPVAKYLSTPSGVSMHLTKARWNEIGVCTECHSTIPWKDVESCVVSETKQIVCKNCKGK